MQIKTITFMKKFIFTAIAMVAFIGSSMANTIDYKTETFKSFDNENQLRVGDSGAKGCLAASNSIRETCQNLCIDEDTANDIANAAFTACMEAIKN